MPPPVMSPPRSRSRSRSQPRRIHHHISMSFSTPENVVPQLYEWVSLRFPFSVVVHRYSISTTHVSRSLSSLSFLEIPVRLSHSSSSRMDNDPDPNDSLLAEFDHNSGSGEYIRPSESLGEELRRRLNKPAEEEDADIRAVPGRDPWTTWFPSTPPLRSREALRSESDTPFLHFSSPGVAPSVLVHILGMHRSEMDAIEEDEVEVAEQKVQQDLIREQRGSSTARPQGICEGLPDDETDFAQFIEDERDSLPGSCLCWACRAIIQRYARGRNLFP
ncbi:hypothetical protein PSPO01_05867 [Paraphaeosphaeria sporulosa]